MNPKYFKDSIEDRMSHLVGEMGEALAAYGKIRLFGFDSYNPEIPEEERETNLEWFLRELKDVQWALDRFHEKLNTCD